VDDLFWESALIAASAANASATFGPGDVPQDLVEEAVRAASGIPPAGGWTFVALTSAAARRRLLSVVGDAGDALRSAPMLIVPCVRVAGGRTAAPRTEASILLAAGAAIRTLVIALHAQGLGSWWEPDLRMDADGARAALALGTDRRPLGIVAVGPMPEGGA
jgi:nitroreductase